VAAKFSGERMRRWQLGSWAVWAEAFGRGNAGLRESPVAESSCFSRLPWACCVQRISLVGHGFGTRRQAPVGKIPAGATWELSGGARPR